MKKTLIRTALLGAAISMALAAIGCSRKNEPPGASSPRAGSAAAPVDSTRTWAHARTMERAVDGALDAADMAGAAESAREIREHVSRLEQSRGEEAQDRAGINQVAERVRGYATRIERAASSRDTTGLAEARSLLHQALRDVESQFPLGVPPLP